MTYAFDDDEKPTGRTRLAELPGYLWDALEHAVKTGKGKVVKTNGVAEITSAQVKEWRAMLRRAEVKARYVVTTQVTKLDNGMHRFTFGAEHAPVEVPETPAEPPAPAPAEPLGGVPAESPAPAPAPPAEPPAGKRK
jgi:hypothetical protein